MWHETCHRTCNLMAHRSTSTSTVPSSLPTRPSHHSHHQLRGGEPGSSHTDMRGLKSPRTHQYLHLLLYSLAPVPHSLGLGFAIPLRLLVSSPRRRRHNNSATGGPHDIIAGAWFSSLLAGSCLASAWYLQKLPCNPECTPQFACSCRIAQLSRMAMSAVSHHLRSGWSDAFQLAWSHKTTSSAHDQHGTSATSLRINRTVFRFRALSAGQSRAVRHAIHAIDRLAGALLARASLAS